MWNPMVVVELVWQVKYVLSHAAAATSFVCSPPPPPTLSKPSRPHYLSYPVAGRWEIERESARSTSPRALQTMVYRSCLLDERGRRRDDPSGLHRSSQRSTAIRLYYAQRHYFSDHSSDPLTSLSSSSRGQECARGCSDGGTLFQYERFPSCCHGFRVRGRRTFRLAGSSSTGDWSSPPGSRKRPPEEEDIWSKSSVVEFRRLFKSSSAKQAMRGNSEVAGAKRSRVEAGRPKTNDAPPKRQRSLKGGVKCGEPLEFLQRAWTAPGERNGSGLRSVVARRKKRKRS
ncbi:unnamed protein product [Ascophyllum nodosum]